MTNTFKLFITTAVFLTPFLGQAAISGCGVGNRAIFVPELNIVKSLNCSNGIAIVDLDNNRFCTKVRTGKLMKKLTPGQYRGCIVPGPANVYTITAIEPKGSE